MVVIFHILHAVFMPVGWKNILLNRLNIQWDTTKVNKKMAQSCRPADTTKNENGIMPPRQVMA